jgi:hypothetical protein
MDLNWREIPFFGAEKESITDALKEPFESPHIWKVLKKKFSKNKKMKAYAWNQALPFCFETIVTIPITVIIFCETELPSLLYLHSTQLQQNLILDTEKTGLKWTPLSSNKRVNILTEQKDITPDFSFITDIPPGEEARDQLIKFAEPYIYRTEDLKKLQAEKKKLENYRHIPFEIEFHGKKISDYYTKQSGDWPEFATTILDDSNFPTDDEKLRDELVPVLKEAVEKEREKRIKDIQDSIDKIENLDEGIKNATIVKVYPTHPHLVLKDTYNLKINGALGNAHELVGYQGYSKRTMDRNIRRSLSAGLSIYGRPTLLKDFLKGSDSEEEKKSAPLPLPAAKKQDVKNESVGVPKKAEKVEKTEKAKEPKKEPLKKVEKTEKAKAPKKEPLKEAEIVTAEVAEEKMDVEKEPSTTTETAGVVADPHPEPSEASRQSRKRKRADKESKKKGKRTNTF